MGVILNWLSKTAKFLGSKSSESRGCLMVSALVPVASSPGSSSGTRCFNFGQDTLTVPLSTQEYKRGEANCWGVTCDGIASRPGGVEILLLASLSKSANKLTHSLHNFEFKNPLRRMVFNASGSKCLRQL